MYSLFPPKIPNATALDLCCGEGYYSRKLYDDGYVTCGVDAAEEMIRLAERKNHKIKYVCADAGNLHMFADSYFDLIVCGMGLMDTPNLEQVVEEVARVAKPKGYFLFAIMHPCFSFEKCGGWETKNGVMEYFKMDRYFEENEATSNWNIPSTKFVIKTNIYHRTISTYYGLLCGAGFVVDRLIEPTYTGNDEYLKKAFAGIRRIPYLLMMRAQRN